ncbi:hypothetical protein [Paenibacillus pabuli]|uniref:hypothetical protein n=1 Tax=Paenibacillus pabuli TaxID=1472 RepID=UPI003CF0D76F
MRNQWIRSVWLVPFPIKFLAAILTSTSLSLIIGIMEYVPLAERAEHTYYYPFWYTLIISILISSAILLFLILPLSLFADSMIASRKMNGRVMKATFAILMYLLLGVGSGVLFSIFVFKLDAFEYTAQYLYIMAMTFVFLLWQLGLSGLLSRVRNKKRPVSVMDQ